MLLQIKSYMNHTMDLDMKGQEMVRNVTLVRSVTIFSNRFLTDDIHLCLEFYSPVT
jgi:hypothetical protein